MQVALLFLGWSPSGIIWWQAQGFALTTLCTLLSWLLLLKAIRDAALRAANRPSGLVGRLSEGSAMLRPHAPAWSSPFLPATNLRRLCYDTLDGTSVTPDQLEVAAVVLTLYCVTGPLLKERRFSRRFGEQFRAYQRWVPY